MSVQTPTRQLLGVLLASLFDVGSLAAQTHPWPHHVRPCAGVRQRVYLFDDQARLHAFNPRALGGPGSAFELLGTPACALGPPLPGWLGGTTPYSLTVSPDGTLWALYTSGQIFRIQPDTLACTDTGFQPTPSWQLFGMAFTTPRRLPARLWVAGGSVDPMQQGDLGRIDVQTLQASRLGSLSPSEYAPSLAGVGERLVAFHPSFFGSSVIRQIDTLTGQDVGPAYSVPVLGGTTLAWAFAYWGPYFWIFVTDSDPVSGQTTQTLFTVDRWTGSFGGALGSVPFIAVAAGAPACVPRLAP